MHHLKPRLFLFLFVIVFIALKAPTLHLAYYWDECWPYATAIKYMYTHGISLLPTAMDPELSRGHPLFFHVLGASWMHVFGSSHIAMHSLALLISVLALVLVYETALKLFSIRAAILAVSLVGVQQMFFVQSAMVLFDMLVALLSFASIVFYVRERYLLAGLWLTIAFFTKESSLIAGFMIGIDALVRLFDNHIPWKLRIYKTLTIAVPCLLIGIFFLLQKQARGWYVFPMYSDMITSDWPQFWYSFRMSITEALFHAQLRWAYFLIPATLAIVAAAKQKSIKPLALLLPIVCVYFMVDDARSMRFLPAKPFALLFITSFVAGIYTLAGKRRFPQFQQRQLIMLSGLFVLCYLIYSTFSFMSIRYLLVALVPMFFLVGVFIDKLTDMSYKWLFYPSIAAIALIGFFAFRIPKNLGDVSMGAFDGIAVHQGVIDYLEQQNAHDKKIATGSFLQYVHLKDPATGFLHSNDTFKTSITYDADIDYAIFDNVEPNNRYEEYKNDTAFHLVYHIARNLAWAEIYQRK